jgi:3-hydroxybutyryl-CoA dehydrogenase
MIKKIIVCGAGTMGNGIAHIFALNGFTVQIYEINESGAQKGLKTIEANLDRQIKKGLITEQKKNETLNNLTIVNDINKIDADSDLVIEAIFENEEAKVKLFNELDKVININCIFASNTSSISITKLSKFNRPDKFIGMHFMNPVPMMKLVEIIKGYSTSEDTYSKIYNLCSQIGKEPVTVNDYPGFISNRILMPLINEAIYALYENVASAEDIDKVMKLGMNHPMGPLQLADFIGLDVCLDIINVIQEGFQDSKYRPCPLLKKMVAAGKLGKKSGEGFYKY